MADWRDIMEARRDATAALGDCENVGAMIEDGREVATSLAVVIAARAVCCELRALGVTLDYKKGGES